MPRVLQQQNRVLSILLFLLVSLSLSGQQLRSTYPVQATVFLRPPYSLYLDDYSNSSTGKVLITLLNRDLMQPESDVRLHIRISGGNQVSLETHPQKQLPVFRLTPGVPYQLTSDELGAYFQSGNLQSSGSFNGRFPEGMLEVCVTVFEANSGLQLSQTACSRAWISQNRPPLLNIPVNGARYPFKEPQNYLFQWTPRHQGLSQVEYILTLKELHDAAAAPEAAFASSQEVFSTTVSGRTSYAYTAMDPPLLDNIVYAWQVQAVARDGFSEVNLFENNGYSEIRTFSMAPSCHAPSSLSHRQEGANAVIEWSPAKEGSEQVVSYRSTEGSGEWHHRGTTEHYAYLFDLSPGREYVYKVGTRCSDGSVTYSEEHTLILEDWRKKIEGSCGVLPDLNLDPSSRLEFLRSGDVFMAGDFPVTVTIVEGGSDGVFSGSGWTRIPMFMDSKVVVNFKGIRLNSLRELVGGYVETSYDINEGQLADLDAITHGRTGTGQTVTGDIWANVRAEFDIPDHPKFKYDDSNGELTVLDDNDQVVGVIKIPEKDKDLFKNKEPFTYVIEDIKGDVYTLTGDGGGSSGGGSISVTQTGTKDTSGKTFNPQKLETKDLVIVFKKSPNSVYTFDTWQDHYKDISLINNKNLYEHLDGYDVPCKLVPPGKTDVVSYELNVVKQGGIDTSKIVFKTGTGIILKHDPEKHELTLNGSNSNDALDIYALYPDVKGDYQLVGKLKVLSYSERSFNLVLVPVNGNRLNESAVSDYLNKEVFNPLGISWTVQQDSSFTYSSSDLLSDGSGLFTSYTDEMKALNSAYKSSRGVSKNTVYLFILNKGQIGDLNPSGDMPRGKQFGYLFTSNGGDLSWTIAHELGHGLFKLQHTFDKEYGNQAAAQKGKTDNLMDYSGGTHLAKWQWDEIFSPALLVNPFEGDEAGMSDYVKDPKQFVDWIKNNLGSEDVEYNKNQFYNGFSVFDEPVKISNPDITFYVDFGASSRLNLKKNADEAFPSFGIVFHLNETYHNGFYIKIRNTEGQDAITIWFYTYENFSKFMGYLGMDLTDSKKNKIIDFYKELIASAGSDCNKLDVIYETIPDFVISAIPSETLYAGIESLAGCRIDHLTGQILIGKANDTDEEKALLNLLNGIDKNWLYEKINKQPNLIEDILLNKTGFRYKKEFAESLSQLAKANWKREDYENSNYYILGRIDLNEGVPEWMSSMVGLGAYNRASGCCWLGTLGEYRFGILIESGSDKYTYSSINGCSNSFECKPLQAIFVEFVDGSTGVMPALAVKYLSKHLVDDKNADLLNLSVGFVLPELYISKARAFKIVGAAEAGDELASAFINGWTKEKILELPKGSRPLPEAYLKSEYITKHLIKFDEGAVRFTSRKSFNQYGILGPDGGFVLPKTELDRILNETGGNLRLLERKLGFDNGYLSEDDIMIALIKKNDFNGLKIPSGNESGANSLWIPGGYTSGGVSEAVLNFSNKPIFIEIKLK